MSGRELRWSKREKRFFQNAQRLFNSFSFIFNTEIKGFQTFDRLFQAGIGLLQLFDIPLHFLNFLHLLFQFHFSLGVFPREQ